MGLSLKGGCIPACWLGGSCMNNNVSRAVRSFGPKSGIHRLFHVIVTAAPARLRSSLQQWRMPIGGEPRMRKNGSRPWCSSIESQAMFYRAHCRLGARELQRVALLQAQHIVHLQPGKLVPASECLQGCAVDNRLNDCPLAPAQ